MEQGHQYFVLTSEEYSRLEGLLGSGALGMFSQVGSYWVADPAVIDPGDFYGMGQIMIYLSSTQWAGL